MHGDPAAMTRNVTVNIVVDAEFGDRLTEIAARGPVWIADTATNRPAAERWWNAHSPPDEFEGVTTFLVAAGQTPEEWCGDVLPSVDMHYGAYDDNPPMYDAVDVWGAIPTSPIVEHLAANGYRHITRTSGGFRASRDLRVVSRTS
jgi:hypothetical protein